MPVMAAPTAAAVFPSSLGGSAYFDALSTSDTTAPPVPAPTIVSASRSPTRALPSTSAGRPGCPPGPGCGPGPRGPRPSGSASFPGGADAARAGHRPCGRRGRAAGSTDGPPSDGPPSGGDRRSAPGSSPPRAAPPPCATDRASSCAGPTRPRCGAPRPSPAPARGGSRAFPSSGAPRARPSSGHAPAGGRSPRSNARFSSGRGSGISRHRSGGAGPRAWRSPSLNTGTVTAIRPIRNIMRRLS